MAAQHTIVLTPELFERVQRLANEQHRSPELVVHDILQDHLEESEWRTQFHRDADEALAHYRETGLHVTGEEMDEWFEKIIAGQKVPLPKCHT